MPEKLQVDGMNNARMARLIARQALKRHLASRWAATAGLAPGMIVLDIGAGTGVLSLEYAAIVAPSGMVIALDPDEACLAFAAAEAARRTLPLRLLHGTAETLPDLPATPDRIMLTDALHHMDDPPAALRSIRTIMPPSSRLFIAEYDPEAPGVLGAPHALRISRDTLAIMLGRAGFTCNPPESAPDEHYTIIATP